MGSDCALVLGGGFDQAPVVAAVNAVGLHSVVVDHAESPLGAAIAGTHVRVSALDLEAVRSVTREFSPKFVASAAMDAAVPVIAEVSAEFELPTLTTPAGARAAVSKVAMKSLLVGAGIPTSRYLSLNLKDADAAGLTQSVAAAGLRYPLVVKPDIGTGSVGVSRVSSDQGLQARLEALTLSGGAAVVVEEYVPGRELSVDCFSVDGVPQVLCVSELEPTSAAGDGFSFIRCVAQLETAELHAEIERVAARVATAFDLNNGPWILQVKVLDGSAEPRLSVVELGARIAGGRKPRFLATAARVDVVEAYVRQLDGRSFQLSPVVDGVTAMTYVYARPGVYNEVHGVVDVVSHGLAEYVQVLRDPGTALTGGLTPRDRVLEFCVRGADAADARAREAAVLDAIGVAGVGGESLLRREVYV